MVANLAGLNWKIRPHIARRSSQTIYVNVPLDTLKQRYIYIIYIIICYERVSEVR